MSYFWPGLLNTNQTGTHSLTNASEFTEKIRILKSVETISATHGEKIDLKTKYNTEIAY